MGLRRARTTGDFYVASRSVTPRWNAAAIGGEYLSAASFLGIAGLVLAYGFDMLWYPVCYTAGYLVLLALVAAPLRRSGAYTLPDFAQIRLGSPLVRAAASVLVVLIGWLYLVPQLHGAALTLRHPDRRAGLAGRAGGVRGGAGRRRRRRHALDHLRAGAAVLAEVRRAAACPPSCSSPCGSTGRRARHRVAHRAAHQTVRIGAPATVQVPVTEVLECAAGSTGRRSTGRHTACRDAPARRRDPGDAAPR